jgi:putative phosphoribosyl transferase
MSFPSREVAGQQLGRWLRDKGVEADLVLGLPRGGVVVAAEVARLLQCPLDVMVVRKIGHPLFREFAVGALAEPDVVVLDEDSLGKGGVARLQLDEIIVEERLRLRDYQARFHRAGRPDLKGAIVLLVDDGLATGATAEAAARAARKQGARKIIVAAPVASMSAVRRLERAVVEVRSPLIDPAFAAVGHYYANFPQTTDEEVLALLQTFGLCF